MDAWTHMAHSPFSNNFDWNEKNYNNNTLFPTSTIKIWISHKIYKNDVGSNDKCCGTCFEINIKIYPMQYTDKVIHTLIFQHHKVKKTQ